MSKERDFQEANAAFVRKHMEIVTEKTTPLRPLIALWISSRVKLPTLRLVTRLLLRHRLNFWMMTNDGFIDS